MSVTDFKPADTLVESKKLRAELKAWEISFASRNSGHKAGREDIKQHPEIAAKYKLYNTLRAHGSVSSPAPPPPPSPTNPKKRRRHSADIEPDLPTPQRHLQGNARPLIHPSVLDPYDPPSTRLTPNPPRTIIGPTPQKNGLVLGLFDLMSPRHTPPKSRLKGKDPLTTPSKVRRVAAAVTPSRHIESLSSGNKQPTTSSVRADCLTPSARRTVHHTPVSSRDGVSHLEFEETPEFLRRSAPLLPSFNAINVNAGSSRAKGEDEISWSPVAVRLPRKPVGKGLSALVKGLRGLEEEILDEELELLREMEGEEMGVAHNVQKPRVQVEDSQCQAEAEMPLGADGEGGESSEEGEEQRGGIGRPLKVWKKKGQKRSTRRVVMRPTIGKWKPEKEWVGAEDHEDEDVREMQVNKEGADDGESLDHKRSKHTLDEGGAGLGDDETISKDASKTRPSKQAKPAKKVSATAHANFRALKIKNKQSKGKRGGKFGRRK